MVISYYRNNFTANSFFTNYESAIMLWMWVCLFGFFGMFFSVGAGATIVDIADSKLDVAHEHHTSERAAWLNKKIRRDKILVIIYLVVSAGFIAASILVAVSVFVK